MDPRFPAPPRPTDRRCPVPRYGPARRFPPDVLSTSGEMLIRFKTDRTTATESGFAFSWTCNATVPAPIDGGAQGGASRNLLVNAPMIAAPQRPLAGWTILSGAESHRMVEVQAASRILGLVPGPPP